MSNLGGYVELTREAKEAGGPEAYKELLERYGFQKGVIVMIPVCIAGCIVTHKRGSQILSFIKDKFGIVTKEDVEYVTKKLGEVKKQPNDECLKCG